MVSQNLMPAYRRGAKQRSQRLRRWLYICAAYTLLMLAGYGVAESVWGRGGRAITEDLERAKSGIATTTEEIAGLQQKLLQAQRLQAANRVLSDQPDWSLLLAMLSETLGDHIVLRSCQIKPVSGNTTPLAVVSGSTADPLGGFRLEIHGYGQGQRDVAKFVLRLEKAGLFKEVKTIRINRETFLNKEGVVFHLECLLMNRSEAKS